MLAQPSTSSGAAWRVLADLYEADRSTDDSGGGERKFTAKLEGVARKVKTTVQSVMSLRENTNNGTRPAKCLSRWVI